MKIDRAEMLTVCTPGFFAGYPHSKGLVLAASVYDTTTWGELREALIDDFEAHDYGGPFDGAIEAIEGLFEGLDSDEVNDFNLEPLPEDVDPDLVEDVYCYVALVFDRPATVDLLTA